MNFTLPFFRKQKPVRDLPPYERGLYYESFACKYLKKHGYVILDRNVKGPAKSEIDIVAKKGNLLVFAEVKARRKHTIYLPLRSIDARKRNALQRAARAYLRDLSQSGVDPDEITVRYDAITVSFDREGIPRSLDHYENFLEEEA